MSIHIKNMEMPKDGFVEVFIHDNGTADVLTINMAMPFNGKPYQYVQIGNTKNTSTIISTDPLKGE